MAGNSTGPPDGVIATMITIASPIATSLQSSASDPDATLGPAAARDLFHDRNHSVQHIAFVPATTFPRFSRETMGSLAIASIVLTRLARFSLAYVRATKFTKGEAMRSSTYVDVVGSEFNSLDEAIAEKDAEQMIGRACESLATHGRAEGLVNPVLREGRKRAGLRDSLENAYWPGLSWFSTVERDGASVLAWPRPRDKES